MEKFRSRLLVTTLLVGVGLPICRTIIEAHGGEIWIDTAARSGATVRFTLPVASQTDEQALVAGE